jgi:hypothetical protein
MVSAELRDLADHTCDHWSRVLTGRNWPCEELHPLLYALEGMIIRSGAGVDGELENAELLFIRLMDAQDSDGALHETLSGGIVRSDVLAQALRAGVLLRGRGYLAGRNWRLRLDLLADALSGFVQPDGGVIFAAGRNVANTWCAMFTHQALYLHGREAESLAAPAAAYECLV